MTKSLKSNITIYLLLAIIFIFCFNSKVYIQSALDGLIVWAHNVLPALFPFFILSRIIISLDKDMHLDWLTRKCFNAPSGSGNIYALSLLSGYPVGAKMISQLRANDSINDTQAIRMLSFCSTSGPVFMIGTVGIGMLHSNMAGIVILISHVLGSFANGLLYRAKNDKSKSFTICIQQKNNDILSDSMYNSIISILVVGGYIVICFVLVDMLNNLHIISSIGRAISHICHLDYDVVVSILNGTIEMTRGCLDVSKTAISLRAKTVLSCGLVTFSGLCVFVQSLAFIKNIKVKKSRILLMKFTQTIFSIIFCIGLSFLLI